MRRKAGAVYEVMERSRNRRPRSKKADPKAGLPKSGRSPVAISVFAHSESHDWPPGSTLGMIGGRMVFVHAYTRVRFGNVEHVCSHWRSR